MTEGGCDKLEVCRHAHQLAIRIHKMSLALPRHELYEERHLHESGSLKSEQEYRELLQGSQEVSRLLVNFIRAVEKRHGTPRFLSEGALEPPPIDDPDADAAFELARRNLKSEIRNPKFEIVNQGVLNG